MDNAQAHLLKYMNRISSNRWLIMKARPAAAGSVASAWLCTSAPEERGLRERYLSVAIVSNTHQSQVFAILLFFMVFFVVFMA